MPITELKPGERMLLVTGDDVSRVEALLAEPEPVQVVPGIVDYRHDEPDAVLSNLDDNGVLRARINGSLLQITDGLYGRCQRATVTRSASGSDYRAERLVKPHLLPRMASVGDGHYALDHSIFVGIRFCILKWDDLISGYVLQFHDNPGGDKRSPPVSIWTDGRCLKLRLEKNADNGDRDFYSEPLDLDPVGKLYRLLVEIRPDTRPGMGLIRIWLNGEAKYEWRGQTCHPEPSTDGGFPYPQYGVYKSRYRDEGDVGARSVVEHYSIGVGLEAFEVL